MGAGNEMDIEKVAIHDEKAVETNKVKIKQKYIDARYELYSNPNKKITNTNLKSSVNVNVDTRKGD